MEDLRLGLRGSADERAAAFSRLLDPSLDREFRVAAVILGNREDAEDAISDAALRAWQHVSQLRDPDRFEAWFTRIVVNVCRDRLHQRRPSSPLAFDPTSGGDAFSESVERGALIEALGTLTPEHRAVIALHYLEGLTIEQVAEHLGTPVGTVKSRLHYGLSEMRAACDAAARDTGPAPGRTIR
ncbi:MAG: RNA polymerase sigma factor [Candidatus Limnocylindria bacterium]